MTIERIRTYATRHPLLPSVKTWLTEKLATELKEAGDSNLKKEKALYRFGDVPDGYIWIEKLETTVDLNGYCLSCFSVINKGYAVTDAKLKIVTFADVVNYFKIPIVNVNTYNDLITKIKSNPQLVLYKVKNGSGKYGVIVDNRLSPELRFHQIISALGGVEFDVTVNYTGGTFSASTPNIGEVSLSMSGFTSVTLEVYPLEEIKK